MTTSGQTSFSQDLLQIVDNALYLLGVYGQGDAVSTNDYTFAVQILNMMLKSWEGQGIHLWTQQEAAIFLTLGQQSYHITANATDIAGDAPIFNSLTSSAAGSTLNVQNTTGISIGDYCGVVLDSGVINWSTVSSIPSLTQIVMAANVASTASAGNNVFTFTNRVDRPLDLVSVRYRSAGGYERPIPVRGRKEFMDIPYKPATGPANQVYYAPQVSDAIFYAWPTCSNVNECFKISYLRRIQDLVNTTDTPDLPQEWLTTITQNLAVQLAPSYGIALAKVLPDLKEMAAESLQEMQLWDAEQGGLFVVPNYRWDAEN